MQTQNGAVPNGTGAVASSPGRSVDRVASSDVAVQEQQRPYQLRVPRQVTGSKRFCPRPPARHEGLAAEQSGTRRKLAQSAGGGFRFDAPRTRAGISVAKAYFCPGGPGRTGLAPSANPVPGADVAGWREQFRLDG